MQFLRTVLWVVLAVIAVVFALANWSLVTVHLWGDIVIDTRLPVLLLGAFLLGLVPTFILHRTTRWSLRRRLDTANRQLAETSVPNAAMVSSADGAGAMLPAAAPIAPPGLA